MNSQFQLIVYVVPLMTLDIARIRRRTALPQEVDYQDLSFSPLEAGK